MPKERQLSFAAGELDPRLWGRSDVDRYAAGARTLYNFLVTPYGSLANRPGTHHILDLEADSSLPSGAVRIVPFIFSEDRTLTDDIALLVFGDDEMRVVARNPSTGIVSQVTIDSGDGYPYAADDLWTLRFAQLGNIIYIVSPDYAPYKLTRTSQLTWTIEEVDFDRPDPPSWIGTAKLKRQADTFTFNGQTYTIEDERHDFQGDSSHPPRYWTWAITRILRDPQGRLYETSAQIVTHEYDEVGTVDNELPGKIAIYPDWSQIVVWGSEAGDNDSAPPAGSHEHVKTRIYRGRSGHLGFIGETTGSSFVDDGAVPDFSNPPPSGVNPFVVLNADGTTARTEKPSVVTFFEGRLYLAATSQRPSTVWASAIEDFETLDEVIPADDADPLSFTLASNRNEYIRSLVPRQKLVALTNSSEWLLGGSGESEILTPNSVAARRLSEIGSTDVAAVSVGPAVFFVHRNGSQVRAVIFDGASGYQTIDVSMLARHLFEGYTIVEWAYAEDPFSILWVVRSDGKLLSLTYVPDGNIMAWAEHELEDATVESVAVIPENGVDAVYLIVNRNDQRYLERFADRNFTNMPNALFLDGATTNSGASPDVDVDTHGDGSVAPKRVAGEQRFAEVVHTSGTAGVAGSVVRVDFSYNGNSADPFANYAGRTIRFQNPTDGGDPVIITLGSRSYSGSGLNRITRYSNSTVVAAPGASDKNWWLTQSGVSGSGFLASGNEDAARGYAWVVQTISGLDHFEGETVEVVIDGAVSTSKTVSSGSITAADWFAYGYAGLGYDSEFESLDAVAERGRQKIIKKVLLEVEGAHGGKVGPTLDGDLADVEGALDEATSGRPNVEQVQVYVQDQYKTSGRVAYKQEDPLPVTILSLTRDFEYGGD